MKGIFHSWVWKLAWRDGRSSHRKLFLSMSSMILGIAALVAVNSFSKVLERAVDEQSKTLLGADLSIESRQPFSTEAETLIAAIGGEQSRQMSFSSMAYFPKSGSTRLVQVRSLQGAFPYYGALETVPPSAAGNFQSAPQALVDAGLMLQFGARAGDLIRLGATEFRIAGGLKKIPGESLAVTLISPRVYIPMAFLDKTQLVQRGSIVRYRVFFKLNPTMDVDRLVGDIAPKLSGLRLEVDTVKKRKAAIGRPIENLTRFLNLVGFIAALLAGVGVASGIHVYAREKISTVAILRCLGAGARETVAVFSLQAISMGLVGSILGTLLGAILHRLLPLALKDFIPLNLAFSVSLGGVLLGIVIGLGLALLFAFLPLVSLRRVPPLLCLRSAFEHAPASRDPLRWLIHLAIAAAITGFAIAQTRNWLYGFAFAAGIAAVFALLALGAKGLTFAVKRFLPVSSPYLWRQGLANLYRPNNQTLALMLSLGLGTFLIMTLYVSQKMLLEEAALTGGGKDPNLILFDVQRDQKQDLATLLREHGVDSYQEVPVVTMRLLAIKGKKVEEIRNDPNSRIAGWALRREYRSTYRADLTDTEKLVAGKWRGQTDASSDVVPISLEKGIAESLGATLGDRLTFDVQGVPVTTVVGSIREVEWHRVRPNFFVVFPAGLLENAPQFFVLTTRVGSSLVSASLQRAVAQQFSNVSAIDLSLVLSTLDAFLSKVTVAVRFMAFFTIITGLVVLAGAVLSGRSQRLRESVLLRILGASRNQIIAITAVEYLFAGSLAALTGVILAVIAGWGLTYYFFAAVSIPPLLPALSAVLSVSVIAILAGLLGCWGIFKRPTLETLRADL